jgi:putative transposase
VLLRREGWRVNLKRVRRLYRLEGLQVRLRVRRRKHRALQRGPAPVPTGPWERWSMDLVHDAVADGRAFRILTVVDQWSRQSPILEGASRLSGASVAVALDRAIGSGPAPRSITARSCCHGRWKIGRISAGGRSTSRGRGSPQTTATSSR